MPTPKRLRDFIKFCEIGLFVEALEEFYADDATMQENGEPPRAGVALLIEHEKSKLSRTKFLEKRAISLVHEGDRVAINWVFDMIVEGVGRVRLDEIAYQEWSGDKIARERFYYDPAQRKPSEM